MLICSTSKGNWFQLYSVAQSSDHYSSRVQALAGSLVADKKAMVDIAEVNQLSCS